MRRGPDGVLWGAAAASALLRIAAAPPSPLPLLTFGALAPLLASLSRLAPDRRGRASALRAGVLYGALAWGLLLLWIPRAALRVGAWVIPGWIGIVGTLALLTGAAAVAFHHLAVRSRLPLWAAAALAWGGMEWVRGAWLGPFSLPWMGLALPLAEVPVLMQGAAWVGEIGLAVVVAATNGAMAEALLAGRRGGVRRLGWTAGVVGAVAALGAVRMATVETEPVARALLVQPAVPLEVKRGPAEAALQLSLASVEAILPPPGPPVAPPVGGDLVVLPETAVPAVLDGTGSDDLRARVAGWARRMGAPVVVGAWGAGPGRGGNAVFVASDDPTARWPSAWKVRLVPGVEWTPGFDDAVAPGTAPRPLPLPDGRLLAPLVCIESAGAEPARALVRSGAEFLVNVTNDAWLAETPWWTRTAAFHQHPAHLAFRAVELGVGALRVGNNGRTEVVDPVGRRRTVVAPYRAGVGVAEVTRLRGAPPFVAGGPWAGPLAVALGLLAAALRRGREGPEAAGAPRAQPR